MHKLEPVVARTPEELAGVLGLSGVAAKEWPGHLKRVSRPFHLHRS
jgi:hypothetical protein